MTSSAAKEAAYLYLQRGWIPVPIPHKEKAPVLKNWQREFLTIGNYEEFFNGHPQNIGILVGDPSGNLIDVDLDCPETVRLAPLFLPPTGLCFGRKSKPQSHYLYHVQGKRDTKKFAEQDGTMLVELRSTGCQTVFPPSVHPSGEQVEFVSDGIPAELTSGELEQAVSELAAAALLARHWASTGSRQEVALHLAGALLHSGWEEEQIEHFIAAVAETAEDDEVDKRVETVRFTASKINSGGQTTGWPTLREQLAEPVVKRLRDWLGIPNQMSSVFGMELRQRQHTPTEQEMQEWPSPPAENAYFGLAGRVVETILPFSEADPVAILAQFLTAFGCAVGTGPHMMVGATAHHARLFTGIVGKTAKARKGDSLQPVKRLFRFPDTVAPLRLPLCNGISSGEGLIFAVRDEVKEKEEVKDPGVLDKRLLVIESELSRILSVMSRQGNTVSQVVREAWDTGDLHIMTKQQVHATGTHICIIGHITLEELRNMSTTLQADNGFLNRFGWYAVRRAHIRPLPEAFTGECFTHLQEQVIDAVARARRIGSMAFAPETKPYWSEIYYALSRELPGLPGAILARQESQLLRLAMVYALLDGSGLIQPDHLAAAAVLNAYSARSVQYIFSQDMRDPLAEKILAALKEQGPMTRTQLNRLFCSHAPSQTIEETLTSLEADHKIQKEQRQTPGRPVELWMLVDRPPGAEEDG